MMRWLGGVCVTLTVLAWYNGLDGYFWAIVVALTGVSATWWALSPPDRAVPDGFYSQPRRFLLTGAASGMGLHLATKLAEQGHQVCVADVNTKALSNLWRSRCNKDLLCESLDVRDPQAWDRVLSSCIDKWGGLDVVMNVAGCLAPHAIQDASIDEIDMQIDVNTKGVMYGTRAAARMMMAQPLGGHIVNVSSMAATGVVSGVTAYAASKFACRGFSLAASKDLIGTGVCVSCFMPDAVQTPMVNLQLACGSDGAMAFSGQILSLEEVERCVIDHILLKRPVETWLSARAKVARFGDIFNASRAVLWAEAYMKRVGMRRQSELRARAQTIPSSTANARNSRRGGSPSRSPSRSTNEKAGLMGTMWMIITITILIAAVCKQKLSVDAESIARTFSSNIDGHSFIVTGGSSGIGEETARVLTKYGGQVIIASHDIARGQSAADQINKAPGNRGIAEFRQLDLASFDSIDDFVKNFTASSRSLNGLILNAGLFSPTFGLSHDGLEQVLQVNHLGHHHLATSLRETLYRTNQSRVVVVSSWWSAKFAPELVQPFTAETYPTKGFQAYGMAKLANVRFAREFSHRMNVRTYSVHPGMIHTNLGTARGDSIAARLERIGATLFWTLMWPFTKSVPQGAATQLYCAVADDLPSHSGSFYDNAQLVEFPSAAAADQTLDHDLWAASQRLIDKARAGRFKNNVNSEAGKTSTRSWFGGNTGLALLYAQSLLVHLVAYWIAFSMLDMCVHHYGSRRKINPDIPPTRTQQREYIRTLTSGAIDAAYYVIVSQHGKVYSGGTPTELGAAALGILLFTDAHFFFTHRLLHWKPLFTRVYSSVHIVHHESHNPGVWSSLSFHPVESIIFFSAYLAVLVCPIPYAAWIGFKIGMVLGPIHAHCGLDLGPVVAGPVHHYLHHAYKRGNYGGHPTGMWDKLFGSELASDGSVLRDQHLNQMWNCRPLMCGFMVAGMLLKLVSVHLGGRLTCAAVIVAWFGLLDGRLIIFPPVTTKRRKVFVVGLSRTGTTSITAALNFLGWRTHHFCGPMVHLDDELQPTVDRAFSDAFDGQTDLAAAVAFEQLYELYPDALFVLTLRPTKLWGEAMVRFACSEPRRSLFRHHTIANRFFTAAYGHNWYNLSASEFSQIYDEHVSRVREFFSTSAERKAQLLELDITALARNGQSHDLWAELCSALDMKSDLVPDIEFPHRFVFSYSLIDQPLAQLQDALLRFGSCWHNVALVLLLLLLSCAAEIFDYNQCDRACGAALYGAGVPNLALVSPGWPVTPSIRGWFGTEQSMCWCENSEQPVPRMYGADNWTEPYTTSIVCGSDGHTYETSTAASDAGVRVVSCNSCGACSNDENIEVYHGLGKEMTIKATKCAIVNLFLGQRASQICITSWMGLRNGCANCWQRNMDCTTAHCFDECILGHGNPLNAANNPDGGSELSSCLACDELHCSPAFLRCGGANRRLAGVATDIERTDGEICAMAQRPP